MKVYRIVLHPNIKNKFLNFIGSRFLAKKNKHYRDEYLIQLQAHYTPTTSHTGVDRKQWKPPTADAFHYHNYICLSTPPNFFLFLSNR